MASAIPYNLAKMMIYMDESGDPGFSPKASKFFLIGYACMKEEQRWGGDKKIRSLWEEMTHKTNTIKNGEFKFDRDSIPTRKKFLKTIKDMDGALGAFYVKKERAVDKDHPKIYEFLTVEAISTVIRDHFDKYESGNSLTCVMDKRLSKKEINKFDKNCKESVKELLKSNKLIIKHQNSVDVKMIQVADYVSGSVWQKLANGDSQYYDIIKSKIRYFEKYD